MQHQNILKIDQRNDRSCTHRHILSSSLQILQTYFYAIGYSLLERDRHVGSELDKKFFSYLYIFSCQCFAFIILFCLLYEMKTEF